MYSLKLIDIYLIISVIYFLVVLPGPVSCPHPGLLTIPTHSSRPASFRLYNLLLSQLGLLQP
jgi:hypothetical protein